jgi:hypothetical protein
MMVDRIIALLDGLDSAELDRMQPARRQKLAALLHHWWKLAEVRPEPKAGVLRDLTDGKRSE